MLPGNERGDRGVAREIELKLELDPSGARSFRRSASGSLGSSDGATRRLDSVYFDTRKHKLGRNGYSLRIRHDGDRRIQTLKAENGAGAGVFDRPEWECDVTADEPDPAIFDGSLASGLAASLGPLAPVFETQVERTTWTVEEGGSAIEIVVDEGTVSAGAAVARIAEIELELKRGEAADLFRLARRLAAGGRLRLAVRSKSERGYALLDGGAQAGLKAEPVRVRPGMNAAEAFQVVARSCIRHFRLNETSLIEARAAESLHQARVAMRRLRSAFTLFREVVADEEVERIKRELRDVSSLLGEARNLDVFASRMKAQAESPGEAGHGAASLLDRIAADRIAADRERAYDRVLRRLGSKRFRLFTLDLAAWIESGPWLTRDETAAERRRPAPDFAAAVLQRHWRKVRKKGRHLDRLEPEARHRVRIDAKKLRYACEFFVGLTEGGKARRRRKAFLAELEALQSSLGDLNDIATGEEMVASLARDGAGPPPDSDAGASAARVGPASEEVPEREAQLLACAVKAQRGVADAQPFWR